jgi:phenylacetate-CoA ligase
MWGKRRRHGYKGSPDVLENWPVLEKEALRHHPEAFVADDCDPHRMWHEHTSGTTGKSLDLWMSRDTMKAWYALFEARGRSWYGVSRRDRWAILGGQLVTPVARRVPPFWVWNGAFRQLYMSSYHLAPDLIPHYLQALSRFRVKYLFGYTSALYSLAQEALHLGRNDLEIEVAITNAEPLFQHQRQTIEEAFGCPVRETYGMSEIVVGASECEAGTLHLWPEAGIVEVMEGELAAPPGTTGDLICTGLLNADMPLIRYRVGDRGKMPPTQEECSCGRRLPALGSVEGRTDDVLYTADGRRIGRLDPVFKGRLPVREAQIIQERLNRVRVRFVPAPGYTPDAGISIAERLRDRMGPIEVVLDPVDEIPRTNNGKFRAVINALPIEEKQRLELTHNG